LKAGAREKKEKQAIKKQNTSDCSFTAAAGLGARESRPKKKKESSFSFQSNKRRKKKKKLAS
jgi:hypothetical protein